MSYSVIQSNEELRDLIKTVKRTGMFSFDLETTGFNYEKDSIVGISVSPERNSGFYIPLGHKQAAIMGLENLNFQEIKKQLSELFSLDLIKVAHNSKFDIRFLRKAGVEPGVVFDTMIASQLVDFAGQHGLKELVKEHFGVEMQSFKELTKSKSIAEVPIEDVYKYACADTDYCLRLFNRFAPVIKEKELERAFLLESTITSVLVEMEENGVLMDKEKLEKGKEELEEKKATLEKQIKGKLGASELNLNSPEQLKKKLNEAGFDLKSTREQELREYEEEELIKQILEYREAQKLLSTFVKPFLERLKEAKRIKPNFKQILATGRIASRNPNLQQLPAGGGKELVRGSVISPEGYKILSADYSQIELRVLAHFTQDPVLVNSFREGKDVHQEVADRLNIDRKKAKTVNFGIIYGITPVGLARSLEIGEEEAAEIIDDYFYNLKEVKAWIQRIKRGVRKNPSVNTISGRVRSFSKDDFKRNQKKTEREAVNTIIQGSAADLMKMAMVRVYNNTEVGEIAKLILTIHDELVFEVKEDSLDNAVPLIKEEMENAWPLNVPVKVDVKMGDNWNNLKEV